MKHRNTRRGFTQHHIDVIPESCNRESVVLTVRSPIKTLGDDRLKARGFTLIELLVVVIIIAILAAIALPQYNKAVAKARAAEIETFIAHVEKAMDLYVLENGYPSSSNAQYVSWDKMGIDVSSYCDSVGNASQSFKCIAKNFSASAPYVSSDAWDLQIYPLSSAFGSSTISLYAYKNGTKTKRCGLGDSLKAKPICDALAANDPGWEVIVGSGGAPRPL